MFQRKISFSFVVIKKNWTLAVHTFKRQRKICGLWERQVLSFEWLELAVLHFGPSVFCETGTTPIGTATNNIEILSCILYFDESVRTYCSGFGSWQYSLCINISESGRYIYFTFGLSCFSSSQSIPLVNPWSKKTFLFNFYLDKVFYLIICVSAVQFHCPHAHTHREFWFS